MKLSHVTFYVTDVPKSLKFYEEMLGIKTKFTNDTGKYAELDTGSVTIGFVDHSYAEKMGIDYLQNSQKLLPFNIGFTVQDVDKAFEKAIKCGAHQVLPPADQSWGQRTAFIKDCNGITVELCTALV
jgi:catechol 2,3-dioxygenase-like lactoylglutathione lyase family enzyme